MTASTTAPSHPAIPAPADTSRLAKATAAAEAALASGDPVAMVRAREELASAAAAPAVDPISAEFPPPKPGEYTLAASNPLAASEVECRIHLHSAHAKVQQLQGQIQADSAKLAALGPLTTQDRITLQQAAMLGTRAPQALQLENIRVSARFETERGIAIKRAQLDTYQRQLKQLTTKARELRARLTQSNLK